MFYIISIIGGDFLVRLEPNMNSDMFLRGLLFEDFTQTLRPASPMAPPNLRAILCLVCELKRRVKCLVFISGECEGT